MAAQRLPSYLKTYRKRSGLTQREVAFLIGWKQGEQLSRYEKYRVIPSLHVALACAIIFKATVKELFPGVCDPIVGDISARIEALIAELEKKYAEEKNARYRRHSARKLSWLAEHHGRTVSSNKPNAIRRSGANHRG